MSESAVPPQNLEAEESVLGAMMLSPGAIDAAGEILDPGDFYRASHGLVFQAAQALHAQGDPVDVVTLTAELERRGNLDKAGGRTRLHELARLVPASANVRHYAHLVHEAATLRGLIRAGGEIARLGWSPEGDPREKVDRAQQLAYELLDRDTGDENTGILDFIRQLAWLRDNPGQMVGLATGYPPLDEILQGLRPGNLIVVAARPSMGKSAFALNITLRVLGRGLPVWLGSMEMSKDEILARLLSVAAQVPGQTLQSPPRLRRLSGPDWDRLVDQASRLNDAPLSVREAGSLTPLEVRSHLRKWKTRNPQGALAVVDYLQLMHVPGKENRVQEVSEISRQLKTTAVDLQVPILALSQLSRAVEQRNDKRPILSDLRESGSIEQDADVVIFLYRDDYYNRDSPERGVAEVHVAKHRNGPVDRVVLTWRPEFAQFSVPALRGLGDVAA